MRERWAFALRMIRRFRGAIRGRLPVTVPATDGQRLVLEVGLETIRALETIPIDANQFLYLRLRVNSAMRYHLWRQSGAARYEAEMVYRRVQALAGE